MQSSPMHMKVQSRTSNAASKIKYKDNTPTENYFTIAFSFIFKHFYLKKLILFREGKKKKDSEHEWGRDRDRRRENSKQVPHRA